MDRREFLIKGFAPVPLAALAGPRQGDIVIVRPAHYLLFIDADVANVADMVQTTELPQGCTINVIPLNLHDGQTIDEAIRLYKMEHP